MVATTLGLNLFFFHIFYIVLNRVDGEWSKGIEIKESENTNKDPGSKIVLRFNDESF